MSRARSVSRIKRLVIALCARELLGFGVAVLISVAADSNFCCADETATEEKTTQRSAGTSKVDVEETEAGFDFIEDGRVVASYQRKVKSVGGRYPRAHYLHPIFGLDGQVLTEDFPEDHLHHRGVFWAWHQVIVDGQRLGDPWVCRRFEWDVVSADADSSEGVGRLHLEVLWKSRDLLDDAGHPKPVVREKATIAVHPTTASDAGDRTRNIDIRFSLAPLADRVMIGGSEDDKGYGGFSVRMKLHPPMKFLTASRVVQPTKLAINGGEKVDISGPIGKNGSHAGITISQLEPSPRVPQPWILRESGSMQNAAFPGRDPIELPHDTPMSFAYRLTVHQ